MSSTRYGENYRRALTKAAKWHGDHTRKGTGIPYLSHLLMVSALVWEDGGTETEAIAALLHDAVEDRRAELSEIVDGFGADVGRIVEHCTDAAPVAGEAKPPWFDRKVAHLRELAELVATPDADGTIRVLSADKLANVGTMLADHHAGEDVFDRFKGGLGGTVWYQREMAALIERARPHAKLTRELGRAVDELTAIMDNTAERLGAQVDRLAGVLGDTVVRGERDASRHLAFELARVAAATDGDPESGLTDLLRKWLGEPAAEDERAALVDSIVTALTT